MQTAISLIYTTCAILYTILAGKGRVICFCFGIIATLCYSYITFKNHLFGNCLLNLGYYLPMQVLGVFEWNKHLKSDKNEIIKTFLPKKERKTLALITFPIVVSAIIILYFSKDKCPILDGITTVLSMLAMYLTVKRCIEQWIVWIIVNLLTIIMWLKVSLTNHSTYFTIIVWTTYFVIGVYFYYSWKKEVYRT